MELKGSKTEKNLMTAFAGESQARNKYTYYASKAKKEGFVQIAKLFEETANNEKGEQHVVLQSSNRIREEGALHDARTSAEEDAPYGLLRAHAREFSSCGRTLDDQRGDSSAGLVGT